MLIVLALQILNLSIYNSDFYSFQTVTLQQPESINPVDSFAELIIESVEGYQDVFPEQENKTEKQTSDLKHNITFKMIHLNSFTKLEVKNSITYISREKANAPFQESYSYLFFQEINHPPS